MAPLRRVLVVQHEDDAPAAMVEPWLERAGLGCDVLRAHHGRALPSGLGDHAGLIVLGGRMGANDDADHRHLVPTKGLIAGTVAAGLPFLGICLGHQLATVALGGQVRPNPLGKTIGLQPWGPTREGATDSLMSALGPGTSVLHWNTDVVSVLPPRATQLATAPDGSVQAVRFGRRAWGVQFHPEFSAAHMRGYLRARADALREDGQDPDALLRAVRPAPVARRVLRRFARLARTLAPSPGTDGTR